MLLNGKKTSAPADSGADGMAVRQSKRRRPRVKRLVAVVLVCALAGGGAWYFLGVDGHTAAAAALNRGNTVLVTADSPSAVNAAAQETPEGDAAPGETASAASGSDGTVYVSIPVTTGVSDGNYIQILDGLQEGDVVAYLPTSASGGGDMMMGGMPGGMGGGMPGGMGGGMPGGGPGGM